MFNCAVTSLQLSVKYRVCSFVFQRALSLLTLSQHVQVLTALEIDAQVPAAGTFRSSREPRSHAFQQCAELGENSGKELKKENRACMHCGAIKKTVQGLRPHENACARRQQHTTQPVLQLQKRPKTKSAPMYCGCMCRTTLAEANGAFLRCLSKGELVEVLDGPIVNPQSHVARILAWALRDSATGWVTMQSKEGWSSRRLIVHT